MKTFIIIGSLVLLCHVTDQSPQNGVGTENINSVNESTQTSCTTARKANGFCVERQLCDYGSAAVDKSLYAPKGYKRPCKMHEVCCPMDSIIRQPGPTNPMNEEAKELNFDDDDKSID